MSGWPRPRQMALAMHGTPVEAETKLASSTEVAGRDNFARAPQDASHEPCYRRGCLGKVVECV